MSQDRDPFERLHQVTGPEPDPVIMNAVIAQSRDAFIRNAARRKTKTSPVLGWLSQSGRWLVPAGAGAVALVAALVVAPGLINTSPEAPADASQVADAPSVTSPTVSRSPERSESADGTIRMGVQPGPGQAPTTAAPVIVSVFEGEGVRIGMRMAPTLTEFYLADAPGEPIIDSQVVLTGEELELLEAARLTDMDLIALRMRVDETRFWRVYSPLVGAYARDPDLSEIVSDATDRAEVERRLLAE
ncbi:hypothetical protein [Devosia chinhatensis]|uniref:Uncharacterized protein n=1 Tax=Devosia chinhatensis TaxID=429727 RepID=A0A0F5FII8_9HYPH|nr:hypothetical protein [Devosia chinhatensis]KKB08661.1 hypothetical protein VE26_00780 [Devosia chinhatensis]